MNWTSSWRAFSAAVLAVIFSVAVCGFAKDGRDFAGFYNISNVNRIGDQVQLTFTLQIFNYSGAEVKNAEVMVREMGRVFLGPQAIHSIKVFRPMRDARISRPITISEYEYERWQKGGPPHVYIRYQDASGRNIRRTIELVHRAALPTS